MAQEENKNKKYNSAHPFEKETDYETEAIP
jgi:hypothetical protein